MAVIIEYHLIFKFLLQLFDILQSFYYDERTHYLWQYIAKGQKAPAEDDQFYIDSIDDFNAMQDISSNLCYTPTEFAEICRRNPRYKQLRPTLSQDRKILLVEGRTLDLRFNARTSHCTIDVYPEVKEAIALSDPHWESQLSSLFSPSRLCELDNQLHSRYQSHLALLQWLQSEQFEIDLAYLNQMPNHILSLTDELQLPRPRGMLLNIILEGNDRVRIGMVNDYTPKEMMQLPSYPREQWREGIRRALIEFRHMAQQKTEVFLSTFTPLFEAVKQIMAGNATHFELPQPGSLNLNMHEVISRQLFEDLYVGPHASRTSHNKPTDQQQTEVILQTDIDDPILLQVMREAAAKDAEKSRAFIQSPDYQRVLEAIRLVVHTTAPLIAYNGPELSVKKHYKLYINLTDSNLLNVSVSMYDFHRVSCQFDPADIKRTFRPWWAKRQIEELKRLKLIHTHPYEYLTEQSDIPF